MRTAVGLLTLSSGDGSLGAGADGLHGGAAAAGSRLVMYVVPLLPHVVGMPWTAVGIGVGIGGAVCATAPEELGHRVDLLAPSPAAAPTFLLVRELGTAPRSLRHRILVTPPPMWRYWTPLFLAEAACCLLGRILRSVHLRVIVTLGSFRGYLVLVLTVLGPAGATAAIFSVCLIAHIPRSPVGQASGASAAARTAAPPVAVVATTRSTAGTLGFKCTGTPSSSGMVADMERGGRLAGRATSSSTRRMEPLVTCADLGLRKYDARLPALVVAAADCFPAWAWASSSTGVGGGG